MNTNAVVRNIEALLDKADRLTTNTPLTRWGVVVARNSYTIDPAKPGKTAADIAADRAIAKATRLWHKLNNWKAGYYQPLVRCNLERFKRFEGR